MFVCGFEQMWSYCITAIIWKLFVYDVILIIILCHIISCVFVVFAFSASTLLIGQVEGSDILVLKLISVLVFILFSSKNFYFI